MGAVVFVFIPAGLGGSNAAGWPHSGQVKICRTLLLVTWLPESEEVCKNFTPKRLPGGKWWSWSASSILSRGRHTRRACQHPRVRKRLQSCFKGSVRS